MWELLLIGLAFSDCIKNHYFTECSSQLTHDAIITGSKDCEGDYPQIYKSLDCTYSCPAGYILDIFNGQHSCSKCPSGTFNIGGGYIYGGSGLN